jgi:hypothetical protein
MINRIGLLVLGLTVILWSGPARADYVVYTSRATFEAALNSEMTETFNQLGTSVQMFSSGLSQANGLILPITVTGSGGFLISGGSDTLGGFYPNNGTYLVGPYANSATQGITVSFAPNTNAGGADVTTFAANGSVTFSGATSQGENFTGSVSTQGANPNAPLQFLGVIATTPNDYITSILFTSGVGANQNIVIDNVSVPEPTSMALFVLGGLVIGVGAVRRLHRSRSV